MKTIKNTLTGFAIALMILGGTAFGHQADSSNLSEKAGYALPEEQYVNDIPFNTAKLSVEAQYQKAIKVQFTVPQEKDVKDIPFNVQEIAAQYQYQKALTEVFHLPAEQDVDDIPFNTKKIFQRYETCMNLLTSLK